MPRLPVVFAVVTLVIHLVQTSAITFEPSCIQDGKCFISNATCCSGKQHTDNSCGYTGEGSRNCSLVCETVADVMIARLANNTCEAIRRQEGADEGVDKGICDTHYDSAGPGANYLACEGILLNVMNKGCALVVTNRTLNPAELCMEIQACGTGKMCGCLANGRCLLPAQTSSDCCHGVYSTTGCHHGHERKGRMCGSALSLYRCINNKCIKHANGASKAECEAVCGQKTVNSAFLFS